MTGFTARLSSTPDKLYHIISIIPDGGQEQQLFKFEFTNQFPVTDPEFIERVTENLLDEVAGQYLDWLNGNVCFNKPFYAGLKSARQIADQIIADMKNSANDS